jgi:hypothetical protein
MTSSVTSSPSPPRHSPRQKHVINIVSSAENDFVSGSEYVHQWHCAAPQQHTTAVDSNNTAAASSGRCSARPASAAAATAPRWRSSSSSTGGNSHLEDRCQPQSVEHVTWHSDVARPRTSGNPLASRLHSVERSSVLTVVPTVGLTALTARVVRDVSAWADELNRLQLEQSTA